MGQGLSPGRNEIMLAIIGVCHSKSSLCCEQATGLKEHLNREKATNQELVLQCSSAEQNVKAMEDEVRLVKRQLAIMAKARDVANQEKEDWKSTCNRYDSNFTHASSEWYAWHNLMLDSESGNLLAAGHVLSACLPTCPEMHV